MPARNIIREYDSYAFYHIYNRGVEKRTIFLDQADYQKFLSILERHLSNRPHADDNGRQYEQYLELEMLAYCLMPNHFHLFVYQAEDSRTFTKLLHSVGTAYTMYFNRKYQRSGHLFQERFRASRITDEGYYQHISRYIHLNPAQPFEYEWSSLPYYLGKEVPEWVKPDRIIADFRGAEEYANFLKDYEEQKGILGELKRELADSSDYNV